MYILDFGFVNFIRVSSGGGGGGSFWKEELSNARGIWGHAPVPVLGRGA